MIPFWARTDDEVRGRVSRRRSSGCIPTSGVRTCWRSTSRGVRDVLAVVDARLLDAAPAARPHIAAERLHRQLGADRERHAQRQRDHRARERAGGRARVRSSRARRRCAPGPRLTVRCMPARRARERLAGPGQPVVVLKTHGDDRVGAPAVVSAARSFPTSLDVLEQVERSRSPSSSSASTPPARSNRAASAVAGAAGPRGGQSLVRARAMAAPILARAARRGDRARRERDRRGDGAASRRIPRARVTLERDAARSAESSAATCTMRRHCRPISVRLRARTTFARRD